MSRPMYAAEFLLELQELFPQHTVFRQGDCVTVKSCVHAEKLSGTIYPYDDHIVLHCHNHLIARRLYVTVDTQDPTGTDRLLELFRDHLDGKLQDSDYNGR